MIKKVSSVLIVGLGKSGREVALLLRERGIKVVVAEIKRNKNKQKEANFLREKEIEIHLGPHPLRLLKERDLVVVSPGVPLEIPLIKEARARKIPVLGELEIAFQCLGDCRLVAITGTNGKSTTTYLTAQMLGGKKERVEVAGNVGRPLSAVIKDDPRIVICEVSSFQLETIDTFTPFISCILNLTPDHLDRHGTLKNYISLKSRIFKNQQGEEVVILNRDDPLVYQLAKQVRARVFFFSQFQELKRGVFIREGRVICRLKDRESILSLNGIALSGTHNWENILAAVSICSLLGVGKELFWVALKNFPGLPHRSELVDEVEGVRFIDDSKATNEGAVRRCLQSLDRPAVLILGGRDKGADFSCLKDEIGRKVKKIVVMGEARERIYHQLKSLRCILRVDDLRQAVEVAFEEARTGDCVVLSPGCASFDQFKDFSERGDCFKREVKKLKEKIERQGQH